MGMFGPMRGRPPKAPKDRPSMPQVVIRLEQILALDPALSTGDWRSLHRSRLTVKRKVATSQKLALAVAGFVLATSSLIGIGVYRRECQDVADAGYSGFSLTRQPH